MVLNILSVFTRPIQKLYEGSGCLAWWMEAVYLNVCVCVWVLDLTAGSAGWLTDFSHFLEGKVACTVASGDCSSETEEHMKSINPCCYYLPSLWNPKRRSHIYKCSQHVICTLSLCITNVCASSLIKGGVILMWLRACDKICRNVSDKHTDCCGALKPLSTWRTSSQYQFTSAITLQQKFPPLRFK